MKDKWIQMKVAQSYKDKIKKAADSVGLNMTRFIINCINKELERIGII